MSALGRLVIIGVAVLAVLAVLVVALTLAGGDGVGEQSSPSPSTATSASPTVSAEETASAAPSVDEEATLATLRRIEEQVIAIRGLPAAEIGPPELISRDQLGDELARIFEEEYPAEEQERDNIALRALGLLEEDQDVAELQLQLLGDQVLGFYDDIEKRMVVVTDAGLDANAKLTYAHEYTHALQDAAFDLDTLQTDTPGEDDRGLARTALIEGDATVSMLAWALAGNLTPEELVEIGSIRPPSTEGIPSWMVDQLQFPYVDGLSWATALSGNPTSPDFDELDAAFDAPPDSTEQIIHIAKWDPRETPDPIPELDLAAAMGDGWSEVDATPIGEETIRVMLSFHGLAGGVADEAGDGWGGDRAVIATGPGDAFAVSWRSVWDSPGDAGQFADAYRDIAGSLPFSVAVVEETDGSVLVIHASSEDLLQRARDASTG
ncbi:MAG TPA: hypothetical protein VFW95_04985 [Candidatus Limnocylindria bacterium]|nr:hypothetical protein [Candidatus Limnocylindria bacterium]